MTNFGVFGTILDIDEENNKVQLETSPGTVLTVHRQVVTRVIDDHDVDTETVEADASTAEPAYGERVEEADETTPDSKPATSGPSLSKTDKVDE
jgi:preprotein translocase subunit YajC